jgi:cytochrome d ubiquinol oxidase subunit I
MIFVVHRRGVRRGDDTCLGLARRWSKVAAVLFAIGAVSGTILSFEMGMLWPGLMGPYGDVIGLPFALEGIAFFTEAIFLGIYLYGWDRLPPMVHYRMLIPIAAAGVVGTFCILAVNSWMNDPAGFELVDGVATDIDPWAAMFNDAVLLQFLHMWVAAFMLVGFVVAGVYAMGVLRGRDDRHHRIGLLVPMAFACVAAVVQPFLGHLLGGQVRERQPAKLAAIELALETERRAPLRLGGVLVDGEVRWAIELPVLGSILATNAPDGEVPGLDQIPLDERPPVNITHAAFQLMVVIGLFLMALAAVFWVGHRRGRDWFRHRHAMWAVVVSGPLAVLAVEAGWVTTEVGRQPWVVQGILRTRDAASDSHGLWLTFAVILVVYAAMTVAAVAVLRSMARRWRDGEGLDLPTPYGPGSGGEARR